MRFVVILVAACGAAPAREPAKPAPDDPMLARQAAIEQARAHGILGAPLETDNTFASITGTVHGGPGDAPEILLGHVMFETPKVTGSLDPEDVRLVFTGIAAGLDTCHGARDPLAIIATVVVRPDGSISHTHIATRDRELATCVTKLIENLPFAAARGSSRIEQTIELK